MEDPDSLPPQISHKPIAYVFGSYEEHRKESWGAFSLRKASILALTVISGRFTSTLYKNFMFFGYLLATPPNSYFDMGWI